MRQFTTSHIHSLALFLVSLLCTNIATCVCVCACRVCHRFIENRFCEIVCAYLGHAKKENVPSTRNAIPTIRHAVHRFLS